VIKLMRSAGLARLRRPSQKAKIEQMTKTPPAASTPGRCQSGRDGAAFATWGGKFVFDAATVDGEAGTNATGVGALFVTGAGLAVTGCDITFVLAGGIFRRGSGERTTSGGSGGVIGAFVAGTFTIAVGAGALDPTVAAAGPGCGADLGFG